MRFYDFVPTWEEKLLASKSIFEAGHYQDNDNILPEVLLCLILPDFVDLVAIAASEEQIHHDPISRPFQDFWSIVYFPAKNLKFWLYIYVTLLITQRPCMAKREVVIFTDFESVK